MKVKYWPREMVRYVRKVAGTPQALAQLQSSFDDMQASVRQLHQELRILSTPILLDDPRDTTLLPHDGLYAVFNPSLVALPDGRYLALARSSNLLNHNDGTYFYAATPHNTENYAYLLGSDLAVEGRWQLDDSLLRYPGSPAQYGLEDCRLVHWQGRVWGVGAGMKPSASGDISVTQILFQLDEAMTRVESFHECASPFGLSIEKNWMPVVGLDGGMQLVYSLDPPLVMRFSGGAMSGPCQTKMSRPCQHRIRGGSPLVRWNEHYFLGIVHADRMELHGKLYYCHHFALFSAALDLLEVSTPFFLRRKGIEFACGLAIQGDDVLVSYGISDRSAAISRIPRSTVTALLAEGF